MLSVRIRTPSEFHHAVAMACIHHPATLDYVRIMALHQLFMANEITSLHKIHSPSNRNASIRLYIRHTENQPPPPLHTNQIITALCQPISKHYKPIIRNNRQHLISVHCKLIRQHIRPSSPPTIDRFKWKQYRPAIRHTIGAITFKMVSDTRNKNSNVSSYAHHFIGSDGISAITNEHQSININQNEINVV